MFKKKNALKKMLLCLAITCVAAGAAQAGIDSWSQDPVTGKWYYSNTRTGETYECDSGVNTCRVMFKEK